MTIKQIIYRNLRNDGLDREEAEEELYRILRGEVRSYVELDFTEDTTVPYQEAG